MTSSERFAEITYNDESRMSGIISLGSGGVNKIEVHFGSSMGTTEDLNPSIDIGEIAVRCTSAARAWCEGEVKRCRGSFTVTSNPEVKHVRFTCNSVGCPFNH